MGYICYEHKMCSFFSKFSNSLWYTKNIEREAPMYKLVQLPKEQFDQYIKNHKQKSHFLQSVAWGELSKVTRNLTPFYVALIDEKKEIQGATLLLQKHLPLGYSYFYAPRGFVLDYNDFATIQNMTKEVVKFVKSKKGIFLKIDPDIIYKDYNYLEEEQPLTLEPTKVFKILKKCGFKHLGFTKNFETSQPRYTFRINLEQSLEELENHFSKTTKQRINKAIKLGTKVEIGTEKDIKEFYHLMTLTEERKDFVSHKEDYYHTLYEIFNGTDTTKATLFLGKVNISDTIKILNTDLKKVCDQISILPIDNLSKSAKNKLKELTRQKENLQEEIKKYTKYQEQYGEEITLNAHLIIEYGDKAWVLYAGNHNILTETYANYHTYYEHLKYCKEKGLKIYDQFGTVGDLRKENPRLGLHEFKKKFGGDYIEFLGEFDYIVNRPMYFVFTKLVPIYRKLIKNKSKKELKHEISRTK